MPQARLTTRRWRENPNTWAKRPADAKTQLVADDGRRFRIVHRRAMSNLAQTDEWDPQS